VGGSQDGFAAAAGYLHQYDVVVVREGKLNLVSYPVGVAMDPRAISGLTSEEVAKLAQALVTPRIEGLLAFDADLAVASDVEFVIKNPTSRPIEVTLTPDSADSRWQFTPDHQHKTVKAGQSVNLGVKVRRPKGSIDEFYREPVVALNVDYLAENLRVPLRPQEWRMPVDGRTVPQPSAPAGERVLNLDGKLACLSLASPSLALPDGPFTIEGWFDARSFGQRVGFLNKTENAEFGLFLSNGVPSFTVHLAGRYVNATREKTPVTTNVWHHVAGVFDGNEVRLYIDGELVATKAGKGKRTLNELPLMIGADVTKEAQPDSFFDGRIDEIRISKTARYTTTFAPKRRFQPDADTLLLLHMDGEVGPWSYDASGRGMHATRVGEPQLIDAR
jgi:hypothetical protein